MVITMVIDIYGDKNNGTTTTAMRTAENLQALGNEVRVIAWMPDKVKGDEVNGVKVLRCKKVAIHPFEGLIEANGFTFGMTDEKSIAEFIKGSDIVHLMLPFGVESRVRKVAKVMGIPVTSAIHLDPESISYNIHMGKWKGLNRFLYWLLNHWVYRYTRTIHTPSENMRKLCYEYNYRSDIHAISNGVSEYFKPMEVERPAELKDKYIIMMTGRLSGEKRQDLLIKAIGHSKYNDKIQLILCGQGPRERQYKKLAKKYLKNPLQFKFLSQHELRDTINMSDLYVHASDVESEAIACIEAFACGVVPVISDSRLSATSFFALDKRCVFKAGNWKDLRSKIEYFIEHPEDKKELAPKYIELAKTYVVKDKAERLLDVFKLEIERDKEDKKLGRTYFSSPKERRRLRRAAKRAGIENPVIYKNDVYHAKKEK
jgi:1,2-diacylglycerol 3-alpha-glucosyltransferase